MDAVDCVCVGVSDCDWDCDCRGLAETRGTGLKKLVMLEFLDMADTGAMACASFWRHQSEPSKISPLLASRRVDGLGSRHGDAHSPKVTVRDHMTSGAIARRAGAAWELSFGFRQQPIIAPPKPLK